MFLATIVPCACLSCFYRTFTTFSFMVISSCRLGGKKNPFNQREARRWGWRKSGCVKLLGLTIFERWSDIDYPKFSARAQGATYPKLGSSFLFQWRGGQIHIPSWWKRTWKMEGRIKKDQGLFQQYEANHLYRWYGLFSAFSTFQNTWTDFLATLKRTNWASIHISCAHFVCVFHSRVLVCASTGICPKTQQCEMSLFLLIYPRYLFWVGKKYPHCSFIYFYTISFNIGSYQSVHQRTIQHAMDTTVFLFHSFFVLAIYLYIRNLYIK